MSLELQGTCSHTKEKADRYSTIMYSMTALIIMSKSSEERHACLLERESIRRHLVWRLTKIASVHLVFLCFYQPTCQSQWPWLQYCNSSSLNAMELASIKIRSTQEDLSAGPATLPWFYVDFNSLHASTFVACTASEKDCISSQVAGKLNGHLTLFIFR